jgi:hypothetical protein
MDPISPINIGGSRPLVGTGPTLDSSRTARPDTGLNATSLSSSRGASDPAAATQMASAITQLLQNIGGGLENDKMLRMLIGLIILMALLKEWFGGQESPQNALSQLGTGGDQPQCSGAYSSSTTIMFEQTTTTIVMQSLDVYGAAADGNQAASKGGRLDVAV